MNPASNVPSRYGITPPLEVEAGEKSEGIGSTEKPLEGMLGGHSVSLAVDDNVLAIASTGQDAGVMEPAGHSLLRRETVQKAASEVASAMSVDRTSSEKMQLQRELEIIDKLEKLEVGPEEKSANERQEKTVFMAVVDGLKNLFTAGQDMTFQEKKSVNENQIRKMLITIDEANTLRNGGKLEEADKKLEPVFEYVSEYSTPSVVGSLCRSKAHILYIRKNVEDALIFFEKSNQFSNPINFPDRLLVLHVRLGIDEHALLFQPEVFYEEIKEWLIDDEKHQKGLSECAKRISQVRIFHDGIKAVFEEEITDTEASKLLATEKFEQSITKLAEHKKKGNLSRGLSHSDHILKFARNLRLIKQGHSHEALEDARKNESSGLKHLNDYIYFQALKGTGDIDGAIKRCEEGIDKGYPFLTYLEELKLAKAVT